MTYCGGLPRRGSEITRRRIGGDDVAPKGGDAPVPVRRLLTLSPDSEPLWVRLYIQRFGEVWAAMIVGDDELPPAPGQVKGLAFFGATAEAVESDAKEYLGPSEPVN